MKKKLIKEWFQNTVILPDWTLEKWGHFNFAIGTQCKKNFWNPVWKIAKMALFNPCMEFENFLGQMSSFDGGFSVIRFGYTGA